MLSVAVVVGAAAMPNHSGKTNAVGTSCLYTCALRPAPVYGTKEDRSVFFFFFFSHLLHGAARVALTLSLCSVVKTHPNGSTFGAVIAPRPLRGRIIPDDANKSQFVACVSW